MSYEYTDQNGDTLNILPGVEGGNVWVEVGHHETGWVMNVTHDDAPAAALAVLESAGNRPAAWQDTGTLNAVELLQLSMYYLRKSEERRVAEKERAKREEQEAEDAKVREFFEDQHDAAKIARSTWADLPENMRGIWRNRYRAARDFFRESP